LPSILLQKSVETGVEAWFRCVDGILGEVDPWSGRLKSGQGQLFYRFRLGDAVPEDHMVRKIDVALDLSWLRSELTPHYSSMGRPSIDPELMIRMLVVRYVFAIRSERLICREVQVNLACRWFCKLGIEDAVPDHSAFSRARNERFRDGNVFRRVFERVVEAFSISMLWCANFFPPPGGVLRMLRLPENVRSTLRTLARSRTLLIDFACHCPPAPSRRLSAYNR
jgi:transposase